MANPEAVQLAHLERRLTSEFGASVDHDLIVQSIEEAAADLSDAPVRQFVPILVERAARRRLRRAANDGVHLVDPVPIAN